MIALDTHYLFFRLSNGESLPFTHDMISVEVSGDTPLFDPEFVQQATASVFHYFKHDLGLQTVTIGQFAGALEKVLRGFAVNTTTLDDLTPLNTAPSNQTNPRTTEFDLRLLAGDTGGNCDLFFFPRLRDELRTQLAQSPRLLKFRGLRGCVKKIVGARRWSPSCQKMHDRIIDFLRHCLRAESRDNSCPLLVE